MIASKINNFFEKSVKQIPYAVLFVIFKRKQHYFMKYVVEIDQKSNL